MCVCVEGGAALAGAAVRRRGGRQEGGTDGGLNGKGGAARKGEWHAVAR